jgi:cytochrome P450
MTGEHLPADTPPADTGDEFAFTALDQQRTKDWDLMARIRAERPVYRPSPGLVFTSTRRDTERGFKDTKVFSSAGDMRAPGVTVPEEEQFLGEIDAPLHPKIRRLLLPGFTPGAAKGAEDWARSSVHRRLLRLKTQGHGDLMADLAEPLPGSVAAHELGIPDESHDQTMRWCNELLHSTWPTQGETERGVGIEGAFPEFAAMLDELIQARLESGEAPRDLLGVMVNTTDRDGWRLSPHHARTLAINVLAGSLSASYMLGNLLYRLLTDRQNFTERLRADPGLIPAAVEESLRLEAPVLFLFRSARQETELGGCPVHTGEHLMLGIGSSGRDESVYDDAGEFRLDRDAAAPDHLAFGAGAHLCLGNHLTRMVGRVVLEETLELFPGTTLRLRPDFEWECVDHIMEYGPERLDVVVSDPDA